VSSELKAVSSENTGRKTMNKKVGFLALRIFLLALSIHAEAQQPGKVPRIGFLQRRFPPTPTNPDPLADAFLQGLRELGYIEGNNIQIEHRYASGRSDLLPGLVAEFLQLNVDVIVVASIQAIRVAKQATKTIPIVIVTQADPVADGLVDSLARPGGNITGLTRLTNELSGKRLELLAETVPGISRVGILDGSTNARANVQDYEAAARALKITLQSLKLREPNPDFEGTFQTATTGGLNAFITIRDATTASYLKRIADLAIKHRLPSMNEDRPVRRSGRPHVLCSQRCRSVQARRCLR
jgi:ABC-type uncharacterized transport system substrate-binding protein